MTRIVSLLALLLVLGGCTAAGGSSASRGPSPVAIADLAEALRARGSNATELGTFNSEPLGGRGVRLCVAGKPVSVYVFETTEQRAAVAAKLNPTDPTKFGAMIIEWMGNPTFWQRDRLIILYLGSDGAVTAALTAILGQPFASGRGMAAGPGSDRC